MKNITIILLITVLLSGSGCGIYSFTGASISADVKTVSIKYFPNNAPMVQPTLSRKFTEALRDKFNNQTSLSMVSSNGDLNIEGEITGYSTEPVAIQGDQKAALQRLKITINVRFTNAKDEKQNFESSFTRFADYDAASRLSDVEEGLIDQINDELTQDVFNKAVVNW
ncbi:MAG: LptE family protein [Bacteroidales bacterium]|nr:LptE family protein [Bacteroidales bacterium]